MSDSACDPVLGPASGIGLATMSGGEVIEVWYPRPVLAEVPADVPGISTGIDADRVRDVTTQTITTVIPDL